MKTFLKSCILFLAFLPAFATTVIPPTFDELVEEADVIFQGRVVDVRSEWAGEGAQRHIMSHVTFQVDDPIKQQPGAIYTLQMLGGTVNGETMGIADAPQFKAGDRDILFVEKNGTQFIPLVGIMHGRFRIREDAGREVVVTNAGEPVTDLALLGKDRSLFAPQSGTTASLSSALSVVEFKAAIRAKLALAAGR